MLSAIFSFNTLVSVWGVYLEEGANVVAVTAYISIGWVYYRLSAYQKTLVSFFVISATSLSSLYAIYDHFHRLDRPIGIEGQPIFSAIAVAVGFLILIKSYDRLPFKKYVFILLSGVHLLALFFLDSTTVNASLIAFGATSILLHLVRRVRIYQLKVLSIIGIFLFLIVVGGYFVRKESFSLTQRGYELQTAVKMIISETNSVKKLTLGNGQYATSRYYPLYRSERQNSAPNEWNWKVIRIHNQFIEWYFGLGLIGLLPWIVCIVYIAYTKRKDIITLSTLVFFITLGCFYFYPPSCYVIMLFFIADWLWTERGKSYRYLRLLWVYFFFISIIGLIIPLLLLQAQLSFTKGDYDKAYIYDPYTTEYMYRAATKQALDASTYGIQNGCPEGKRCDKKHIQKQLDTGLEYINRAIKKAEKGEYYNARGTLLFYRYLYVSQNPDDIKRAESDYKLSHTYDPTDPTYVDDIGQLYLESRDYATAEQYFKAAIHLKSDYIISLQHLKELYKQTHNTYEENRIQKRIDAVKSTG